MKICKKNTLELWEICYGKAVYAEDFHGNLMCRNGCGNPNYYIVENGERIFVGGIFITFYLEPMVVATWFRTCFVQTLLQMRRLGIGLHSDLRIVCIKSRNIMIWSMRLWNQSNRH